MLLIRHIHILQYIYDLHFLYYNDCNCWRKISTIKKAPKLINYINNEKYEAAAKEFLDITNKGTEGLVKRRKAEYNLYISQTYDSKH
jgi:hypothetical protein